MCGRRNRTTSIDSRLARLRPHLKGYSCDSVADALWDLLNSLAAGGAMWLTAILALAAVAPFLLIAYAGRLLGSTSAYHLSSRLGPDLLQCHARWLRVTPERLERLRLRLSNLVTPTIVLARFTPGLTVLTSIACGASNMGKGQFLKAVAGQLVAWELAFLSAGALGGLAARSIDPSTYPEAIAILGLRRLQLHPAQDARRASASAFDAYQSRPVSAWSNRSRRMNTGPMRAPIDRSTRSPAVSRRTMTAKAISVSPTVSPAG